MKHVQVGLESIAEMCATNWRLRVKDIRKVDQIRLAIAEFLPIWQRLTVHILWPQLQKTSSPDEAASLLELMSHCASVAHSFTYELPTEVEKAFEEVMETFYHLLNYQKTHSQICNARVGKYLAKCWNDIVHVLRLIATLWEEDINEIYGKTFMPVVWELVPRLAKQDAFTDTIITSFKFLTATVRYNFFWERDASFINELVHKILITYLRMDEDIVQMFEHDPNQFLMEDMENSKMDTPRREAIELIKKLCEHQQHGNKIKQVMWDGIQQLLGEYEKNKAANFIQQLLATDFMIGISVLGQTKALGVTRITQGIPIQDFFVKHIVPELQGGAKSDLVLARCIRFLNMFRIHLPARTLVEVAVHLAKTYMNKGEVITSYIAILISNIAEQKTREGQIFVPDEMLRPQFPIFVKSLKGSFKPETQWQGDMHRMKALLNLCIRCESVMESCMQDLVQMLQALIGRSATTAHNPEYTYFLYETFGLFIRSVGKKQGSNIELIEKTFGQPLIDIIQNRKREEVIPFAYQVMALLLSLYSQVPPLYKSLFDASLGNSQAAQDSSSAVPFLTVYMAKTDMFSQREQLQKLLTRIKTLLSDANTITWGLDIANAVLKNEAIAENHEVAIQVFRIILQTLMTQNAKRFVQKDFCRLLVNFVVKFGAPKLRMITEVVQNGFYLQCLEVIHQFSEELPTFHERNRFIHALVALIADKKTVSDSLQTWMLLVHKCIDLMEKRQKADTEADRLDLLEATGQGSANKITYLVVSIPFLRESIPSVHNLKLALAKTIHQLHNDLPNLVNVQLFTVWGNDKVKKKYAQAVADYLQASQLNIS